MATWVRTLTTGPTALDADLTGPTGALSNATAPADFDPDAVSSVRLQWTNGYVSGSFGGDSWDSNGAASFGYSGTILAEVAAGATDIINVNGESFTYDVTDSSIPTGSSVAQWESAVMSHTTGEGAFAHFTQDKGKDGVTVGVTNITVTITYTPVATDRTARVSWAELETPNAPRAAQVSWAELEVPNAPPITQVGTVQTGSAANGGDVTLTFDGSPAEGDLVVVIGGNADNGAGALGPSTSGYTEESSVDDDTNSLSYGVWWKVMGASPDTTVVCQGTGAVDEATAYMSYVFRGVDPNNPFDAPTTYVGATSTANPDPPTNWPKTDQAIAIAWMAKASSASIDTYPSGYSSTGSASGVDTNRFTVAAGIKVITPKAAENPGSFGLSLANISAAATSLLRPAWPTWIRNSSGAVQTSSSTTIVLDKPVGTVEGDTMYAVITHASGTTVGDTPPTGWSDVGTNPLEPSGFNTFIYKKVAGASEGSSYTFTFDTASQMAGAVIAINNANVEDVALTEVDTTHPNSITLNSISTNAIGLIGIALADATTPAAGFFSSTSGMTVREDWAEATGPIATLWTEEIDTITSSTETWTNSETISAITVGLISVKPASSDRTAQVSWAELEVPTAPRTAIVSWAELEVPTAPRSALVSWAELEVPNVPDRAGQVTWAELEVPDAPRAAQISWVELEIPPGARAAQVTWAELEIPTAPRTAQVTWTEFEVPNAPRAAQITWTELEVPNPPQVARVSWVELEIPTAPRTAQVTWVEMELPTAPRTAVVSWAELEAPDAPRAAQISWAELEIPPEPRSALVSWMEMEIPTAPRKARISWAELEVQDGPRAAIVSWTELSIPEILRRARITWAELEAPDAPRSALVSWAEYEVPNAPRSALLSWVEVEVPTAPRSALVSWAELEVPTAPRSAQVSWLELEVPTAPRAARISWVEYEVPPFQQTARVSWAVLTIPNAGGVEDTGKLPLLGVGI